MGEKDSARHEREWPVIMKVAQEYKLDPKQTIALLALRETERGGKGYEMGVKAAKGTDLETQTKWAAGSIKANTNRYNQLMTQGSYKGSRREIKVVDPSQFETKLSPEEEKEFQQWKSKYAPNDSGQDYDLRGAYKSELKPDPNTKHWPDTFKKPNHPTFSNESVYAKSHPELAGRWEGEKYLPTGAVGIPSDTDFIDFMWRYGSPTAYGYAPIDSPEMGEKEIELNKNWGKNMKFNFEKIKKQFSEKGVDYGTKP